MTSEAQEETSPKPRVEYSEKLVDRIANCIADGYSLREISEYKWSPSLNTLFKWQSKKPYARERWFDARFTDAPVRLYDKLQELKKIDLEEIADRCARKENLSPTMREKLMQAMINHIYKERELVIRELEAENPEKWGKKGTQIDLNLNFKKELEMKSLPELEEHLKQLGFEKKQVIDGECVDVTNMEEE